MRAFSDLLYSLFAFLSIVAVHTTRTQEQIVPTPKKGIKFKQQTGRGENGPKGTNTIPHSLCVLV